MEKSGGGEETGGELELGEMEGVLRVGMSMNENAYLVIFSTWRMLVDAGVVGYSRM